LIEKHIMYAMMSGLTLVPVVTRGLPLNGGRAAGLHVSALLASC